MTHGGTHLGSPRAQCSPTTIATVRLQRQGIRQAKQVIPIAAYLSRD